MNDLIQHAVIMGLLAPFVIVGTGVVLGLTLAVMQFMLGIVMGMIRMFYPEEEECCLLYTSPSPRDGLLSRMPSSA